MDSPKVVHIATECNHVMILFLSSLGWTKTNMMNASNNNLWYNVWMMAQIIIVKIKNPCRPRNNVTPIVGRNPEFCSVSLH
mmetsp:Transcript_14714/g.22295  ORF Transcript_14714/g.22295 Transcript_14714/m.22295 type:complete len:81 (+) Transcript_14714:887-1129(+)